MSATPGTRKERKKTMRAGALGKLVRPIMPIVLLGVGTPLTPQAITPDPATIEVVPASLTLKVGEWRS
jgi:hypothetical protein